MVGVGVGVLMALLVMMMMTYLSYCSSSARGRATQRHIPSDDEFISAADEMSCQGPGLCTGRDLCSPKHSVRRSAPAGSL